MRYERMNLCGMNLTYYRTKFQNIFFYFSQSNEVEILVSNLQVTDGGKYICKAINDVDKTEIDVTIEGIKYLN